MDERQISNAINEHVNRIVGQPTMPPKNLPLQYGLRKRTMVAAAVSAACIIAISVGIWLGTNSDDRSTFRPGSSIDESEPAKSSKAPPWVVCGQTLWNAPAGAYVERLGSAPSTITAVSAGNNIFIDLRTGCEKGAKVTVQPKAARVEARSLAKDGKLAAIVLHPRTKSFSILVSRPHMRDIRVSVALRYAPQGP